jgi:hypothetical protein
LIAADDGGEVGVVFRSAFGVVVDGWVHGTTPGFCFRLGHAMELKYRLYNTLLALA